MNFSFGKAILTSFIGLIISYLMGSFFNDGGMASMTAVCYVGTIIVGLFSKKTES